MRQLRRICQAMMNFFETFRYMCKSVEDSSVRGGVEDIGIDN